MEAEGEGELEEEVLEVEAEAGAEAGDFLEEPRGDFLEVEALKEEEVLVLEVMVVDMVVDMVVAPWEGVALVASLGTDFNHIECNFVMFRFYLIE